VPAIVLAFKERLSPIQSGLLLLAAGAAGEGFTVTETVPVGLVQLPILIITEYVPAFERVAPARSGFCEAEEKPAGPFHEYVAPRVVVAVKLSVVPEQTGELPPATGADGGGATITLVVPAAPAQPDTETETEYVPASAVDTLLITGFCKAEEKPLGPDHEYEAPATVFAVKLKLSPRHKGPLFPVAGAEGIPWMVTEVVPAGPVHPFSVAVTE
jgi:hypothetical protein